MNHITLTSKEDRVKENIAVNEGEKRLKIEKSKLHRELINSKYFTAGFHIPADAKVMFSVTRHCLIQFTVSKLYL